MGRLQLKSRHRLMCGDSTRSEDVERLMNGERANTCFTSPPYDRQRVYTEESQEGLQDWTGLMNAVFSVAPMRDDGQLLVNLGLIHRDNEWVPYWQEWMEDMRDHGWRRFGLYVWDQGPGMPGDWNGRLAPAFELVFHFNRESIRPRKARPCKHAGQAHGGKGQRGKDGVVRARHAGHAPVQDTAILDNVVRVNRQGAANDAGGHPAPFPVGLPAAFLMSWPGIVYEPFSGSGTTLIAAEQLGLPCRDMEISPLYCDIAVERWQRMTNERAVRLGSSHS